MKVIFRILIGWLINYSPCKDLGGVGSQLIIELFPPTLPSLLRYGNLYKYNNVYNVYGYKEMFRTVLQRYITKKMDDVTMSILFSRISKRESETMKEEKKYYYTIEEMINFKGILTAKNNKAEFKEYPTKKIINNGSLFKFLKIKSVKTK